MSQRTFKETECDGCHRVERKEQESAFIPPAWRYVQIGYYGTADARSGRPELVPEHTGLLCDICTSKVVSVLGVAQRAS